MAEDLYLIGYGFLRGFIGGILSRFGVTVSDMTLDILAIVLGYYFRGRPGWQGVVAKVLYIGGLVSIGLEIGQNTGRSIADELFRALPLPSQQASGASGARATVGAVVF
jgi:hypothetical protein